MIRPPSQPPSTRTTARSADRYEGGYAVRVDHLAHPVIKLFPWKEGEPGPLDEDMRKAGFTDEEIGDIQAAFYAESVVPRP